MLWVLTQHGEGAGPPSSTSTPCTGQSFAENAGRDMFFNVKDKSQAISVVYAYFGPFFAADDLFIVAERHKVLRSAAQIL